MKKQILSLALALAVCLGLTAPALAAKTTSVTTEEELRAAVAAGGDIVLESDIGTKEKLVIKKSSYIDLNGHKLTVVPVNKYSDPGILIDLAQTLTISDSQYSRFQMGDGKLYVNGYQAGIITSGATLVVNSGVVEAVGDSGPGIGGMAKTGYEDAGTLIINGGIVTAKAGTSGAGIGGASGAFRHGNGGTVTINGGTVTAVGGWWSAGIGGGGGVKSGVHGGTITINGGTVRAQGASGNDKPEADAADIGEGQCGTASGGSVKINGGTIELQAAGINAKTVSIRSCTILGEGAGDHKGSYDAAGNLVTVTGTSGWAADSVAGAVAKGLVPQDMQSDYTQPTTRAQFCALAVAFYEQATGKAITQRKTFSDTSDPNIEKMGGLGIVSGVGGDRFAPNGTLTREQAATMLARLAEAVGEPLPEQMATFADRAQISSWAAAAVGQVQGVGVMGGVGDNRFDPSGLYSREQSMITLLRLYELLK